MLRKKIVTIFLMIQAFYLSSQTLLNKPVFISPGISIGYTFDAKINYGFTLDVGFIDNTQKFEQKYGLSFYQYFVQTKKHVHRLRAFSVMYKNNYIDVKLGRGRAKNPWGFTNRNKCIVHGLALDVGVSYPSIYSPTIGYRLFKFNRADWAWFMHPYHSVYVKYNYDIIQNTPLKETFNEK